MTVTQWGVSHRQKVDNPLTLVEERVNISPRLARLTVVVEGPDVAPPEPSGELLGRVDPPPESQNHVGHLPQSVDGQSWGVGACPRLIVRVGPLQTPLGRLHSRRTRKKTDHIHPLSSDTDTVKERKRRRWELGREVVRPF